jgi:hypothetical protein
VSNTDRGFLFVAFVAASLAGCGGSSPAPSTVSVDTPALPPPPLASDADLIDLALTDVTVDQIFQSSIVDYTGSASSLAGQTRILATTSDANASLDVDGMPLVSGTLSSPLPMQEGSNVFEISVTAENGVTTQTYTVSIERGTPANLQPSTYVKASNTGADDRFGREIALSDNSLAISANQEDGSGAGVNGSPIDDGAANAGAVYVFSLDTVGSWLEQAYVKPSNTSAGDAFGHAIALDGNTLAVSAYGEDSAATGIDGDETDNAALDAGAVYVFTRDATNVWSQQAYIKAPNSEPGDGFGAALDLDRDMLVVGADREDGGATGIDGDSTDNSKPDSGAVYVYSRDANGAWSLEAYLKASNSDGDDQFGSAVSLSGDTLAVGAHNEASKSTGVDGTQSNNSWPGTGAVYVFARDDTGTWSQQAYVKASNTGNGDLFGASVSLSGDFLAVGAPFEDSAGRGIAAFESDNKALNSGATYVFARDSQGVWTQDIYIKASNGEAQDLFGRSLELRGNLLAVGALEGSGATGTNGDQSDNSQPKAGAVYLFERDGDGTWSPSAYLKASNTGGFDEFGTSIALGSSRMAASAPLEDSSATGVGGDQINDDFADAGAVYIIE